MHFYFFMGRSCILRNFQYVVYGFNLRPLIHIFDHNVLRPKSRKSNNEEDPDHPLTSTSFSSTQILNQTLKLPSDQLDELCSRPCILLHRHNQSSQKIPDNFRPDTLDYYRRPIVLHDPGIVLIDSATARAPSTARAGEFASLLDVQLSSVMRIGPRGSDQPPMEQPVVVSQWERQHCCRSMRGGFCLGQLHLQLPARCLRMRAR
ncbi:uncharacterized protein BDW43DRAFT_232821 [Aspergillus alliaceus]|uniref:uncharacterized protein n=1 Tax=Petromyces alliaceus TaxID=209559 RepID=UPI0012A472B8|nr:uncharacterized protein BDW43DRAFT_232821 [Aspergillus alliaceus]KAB8227984.1 hypothetical protein BDW43DRAFT_232821 [Aspergillus alliaceus]